MEKQLVQGNVQGKLIQKLDFRDEDPEMSNITVRDDNPNIPNKVRVLNGGAIKKTEL